MRTLLEDRIRDFLAENLDLLEPHLELIGKEYQLPSRIGAGGRIDLLAKDPFGHFVLIEIKRSNQAARQALNEIHKYTALFRAIQGLDETRVRIIVVSTEWHELLIPLSEFAETARYTVDGISITASSDGTVTGASKVSLVARSPAISLSRCQGIYLFVDKDRRDEELPRFIDAIEHSGIEDYVVFQCDYIGGTPEVIYRYALYLSFVSPLPSMTEDRRREIQRRANWDNDLEFPEENFLCALDDAFVGHSDSFEIGYPEKLVGMRSDWKIRFGRRAGRLHPNVSLLTDEEVLDLAQAVKGGSHLFLAKISSPRFAASWAQLRADIDPVLLGNRNWKNVVPLFLDEVESGSSDATVSVTLFNPGNLPLSLFYLSSGDPARCPFMEVAIDEHGTQGARILVSALAWNGKPILGSPSKMMKRIYGSFSRWQLLTLCHEGWNCMSYQRLVWSLYVIELAQEKSWRLRLLMGVWSALGRPADQIFQNFCVRTADILSH